MDTSSPLHPMKKRPHAKLALAKVRPDSVRFPQEHLRFTISVIGSEARYELRGRISLDAMP
jgi:hypothetical protein